MIRRTLLAAVTTLMMLGSVPAVAQTFVSDTLNPDRFGPVRVILEDAATDGCWTNLGEAKTYAEDQLKRLGYTVVTEEYLSRFSITVHSQRLEIGQCWGSIQLQMYRSEGVQGLYGVLEVASKQAIFVNRANANI